MDGDVSTKHEPLLLVLVCVGRGVPVEGHCTSDQQQQPPAAVSSAVRCCSARPVRLLPLCVCTCVSGKSFVPPKNKGTITSLVCERNHRILMQERVWCVPTRPCAPHSLIRPGACQLQRYM